MGFLIFLTTIITVSTINGKLLSDKENIAKYGVIFQNIGKINLITSSHNLVIPFDSSNIIDSANLILSFMNESIDLINKEDSKENHVLHSHFIYILKNIIIEFVSKFDMFKRYIKTFDTKISLNENSNNLHLNTNREKK